MDNQILTPEDVVFYKIDDNIFNDCIDNSSLLIKSIIDRNDLHERSLLERYIDILMGEIAEKTVVSWLKNYGKYAEQSQKNINKPDNGYDIVLHDNKGNPKFCSVKSSLSVKKSTPKDIIETFQLSSKVSEIQDVNIQVYYWLKTDGGKDEPRINVPSTTNMAIFGWAGRKDIPTDDTGIYNKEKRETVNLKMTQLRPMYSLLSYLS